MIPLPALPPSYNCGKCYKIVCERNRNIKCDICLSFFHIKCSIKTTDYEKLDKNWICCTCSSDIFAFSNIESNDDFVQIFSDNMPKMVSLPKKSKCGECNHKIKNNFPYICCSICSCYFHISCSGNSGKNFLNVESWSCSKCLLGLLPFSTIDQNALLLTLDGCNQHEIEQLNKDPSFSIKSLLDKMPGQKFNTDEFLSDNTKSAYYSSGEFLKGKFSNKIFSIMHLNIASLQRHIDDLRSFIFGLKHKFDIICISETRLYEDRSLVNIDLNGYKFVHTPTSARCGGVGMYVKSNLEFNKLETYSTSQPDICESIFIEVLHPTKKNIVVGAVYRHHTDVSDFIDNFFKKVLQNITKSKKACIIAGDFNVDLIKFGNNSHVDNFYNEISSFSFRPLILQPSRVTSNSSTLIDNIFINDLACFSTGGNITSSVSDHFTQFAQVDIFEKNYKAKQVKFSRDWKNFNRERFNYELSNLSWTDVTSADNDTNISLSNFYSKITDLLNHMAPVKRLTKKEKGLFERPWITSGLLKSMISRDKCFSDFRKEKNADLKHNLFNIYKRKRNMVTSLLRLSKKMHYNDYFLEHQSNIKKTWEGIRGLLNVNKKGDTSVNKLFHNNIELNQPEEMANAMNNFFINIGRSVENKIPQSNKLFNEYLGEPNRYSITLNDCTTAEINEYIDMLNVSKASGPFSVPTNILINNKDVFLHPLTTVINKSITEGVFPNLLKTATVCPIYKKGNKTLCANYRPISLLSNIGKIFERAMYNRIEVFLNEFELIYENQFGFRKKHSTNHALISIVEQIRKNLDNKTFSCGIFVDLEKAFDTVNHNILISKLDHMGITDKAKNWISSYLSDRNQHVKLNGAESKNKRITCGVPQGSILGPLLFIIYINDLHRSLSKCSVFHFADDTNLLFTSKNSKYLAREINGELKSLFDWLCANRLSLNVLKTEFIIFRPPRTNLEQRVVLKLNGTKLFESSKIKYLGIILDNRLSWKYHIHELSKKLNRAVGMVFKIRDNCTKTVLRSLYFSLFNSHMSYGIPVWGKCNALYLNKLVLAQKKIVRAITLSNFGAPSSPLFKDLKILKFEDLLKTQLASLMWDFDHGMLPRSLNHLFIRRADVHGLNLRNAANQRLYTATRHNSKFGSNSFSQVGSTLLNQLKDLSIYNDSNSKNIFIMKYKRSLIENY